MLVTLKEGSEGEKKGNCYRKIHRLMGDRSGRNTIKLRVLEVDQASMQGGKKEAQSEKLNWEIC